MSTKFGHVSTEDYPTITQKFSRDLMNDKFVGNQCKECGSKYFPPRTGCENLHTDMEDITVPTEATLKAFTIIHFAPEMMGDKAPYVVAIGELENGISVLAHLVGITAKPKVGMNMKLKSQKVSDDRVIYKFTP
ncbi:MAG: Zn-ribbon domain-containing OB-fold protein [Candidatus Kariarchaeaceae archaeon]